MGILENLGFGGVSVSSSDLPTVFDFLVNEKDFVDKDVQNIYKRILTDVVERTHGIPEKYEHLLWDNCLGENLPDGLITMLAKAIVANSELFIVFDKATGVLREATREEKEQIKEDYKNSGQSKVGIYVSFKNYKVVEMLRIYSALEYCTVHALNTSMNVSTALQIKLNNLRESVPLSDKSEIVSQAKDIVEALKKGKPAMLDGGDSIETSTPDVQAAEKAMDFIARKQSFYLGLPASYITGLTANGLGDSGEGDSRAVERGLKPYFYSMIKPSIEKIFGVSKLTFKSEDNHTMQTALSTLQAFSLTDTDLISQENKTKIINKVFGLAEDEKGDEPQDTPPVVTDGPD